jgi:type IV pilus assembly protein PilW
MKHPKQRGLSLIELLVALSIGSFLIIGAVTVQMQTRKTFTVNENQARLQEVARYALSVLEPDIQLASLYGYSNIPWGIKMMDSDGNRIDALKIYTGEMAPGAGLVWDECGTNEVFNVYLPIQAENGQWRMGCDPKGNGWIEGTDTLTVRHSSTEKVDPVAGRMQLYTDRTHPENSWMIMNGDPPDTIEDRLKEVRDYFTRTYYIAQDSEGRPNLPALRVKQISSEDGEGAWDDQEVVRGVEDIQIELGVDPGDPDANGVIDVQNGVSVNVNGNVGRYVTPGDDALKTGQVVAVRIWIRVRAEEAEQGFLDQRVYNYASVKDFQPGDGFRRALVSRTIFLRNTRMVPQS